MGKSPSPWPSPPERGNRPRAGRDDYVINQAALAYMRDHGLPQTTIALLAEAERRFTGREAFMAHLEKLGWTAQ